MSTTHELSTIPKKKRTDLRLQRREALPRSAYTVSEWSRITATSKALIYRQMRDGELRFAQLRGTRRIPASELVRLGLSGMKPPLQRDGGKAA
jgi:excisionase family DNA binding protein